MTDANTLTPTDADIIALADKTRTGEPGREGYILPISFARAVLAKWGAPAIEDEIRKQDEALIRLMLEALECSGEPDDPGHRCSHCDDYVDRNSVLRNAARKRLEAVGALMAAPAQPVAVPAVEPVGFDHKTAANFLNKKTVTDDEIRLFVAQSRWAHDDRDWLRNTIADLRREIAQRDAEIALLKTSLLDAEAPQPPAQAQPPAVVASKLGDICSFRSSVARKGDVVYFQPPAQAQDARQPLNDEALDLMCEQAMFGRISMQQFARSIESVHGIR